MEQDNKLLTDKSVNVLIAEDNGTNMLLVKCILENILPDATIWTAKNGLESIELFKSVGPDIVFMDVRMPVKNGYEATQEIRKLDKQRRTPIIALTAGTQGERERCLQSGMDDYISKPIIQDSITNALDKWLHLSGQKLQEVQGIPIHKKAEKNVHYDEVEFRNRLKNREELVSIILQESKKGMNECLDKLHEQWKNEDFDSITQTAHKLKGMAMSSSFNQLAKLASELEELKPQDKEINNKITLIESEIILVKSLL